MTSPDPGLFGIKHSNRDFTRRDSWGKNQFNSSFPASLASYMHHKGFEANYICLDHNNKVFQTNLNIQDLFGIDPNSDNIFFAFESPYMPYQQLIIGNLPRIDLVIQEKHSGACLKGLEIKLTALPDNSTHNLVDASYSCEIVVRPDTIVYLACEIAKNYKNDLQPLRDLIGTSFDAISDWSDPGLITPWISKIADTLRNILRHNIKNQIPLLIQPVWKTEGKSPRLNDNCLDMFVWSNLAHAQFILDFAKAETHSGNRITRQARSFIWIFKMLYDFSKKEQIDHATIIDDLSYNTKNDKAYAANGRITYPYLRSANLTTPRIKKNEIKNIILGGGQNLLSPERRFDAIIYSSPEISD